MSDAPGPSSPLVKICGLTRPGDARLAEALGADFLGTVVSPGFGRSLVPGVAADVLRETSVSRVAVVVDAPPEGVAESARAIGASVIQLHGQEDAGTVRRIRELGAWTLWKSVRARHVDDLRRVVDTLGEEVDGILVEGWREGVVGGGGATLSLDPEEVRAAVPADLTFVLAGGLTPESVDHAVARFRPDVVDVSSGVEQTLGEKSAALLEAFIRAARPGRERS